MKWSKLGQKSFWLILWVFLFMPSYTLSYAPRFCQMKDLIKIYICGKFHHYSICGCDVKDFWIDAASMNWPLFRVFWALTFPNILKLLAFWQEVVSNKTNSVFEKSFKNFNFSLNGEYPKFTDHFHFGAQCTSGKPKILLKKQNLHP